MRGGGGGVLIESETTKQYSKYTVLNYQGRADPRFLGRVFVRYEGGLF